VAETGAGLPGARKAFQATKLKHDAALAQADASDPARCVWR
jgi:hypothetical protein